MSFRIITAAEAASYVKHGYNVGLGGFTPAGTPKTVTAEIARLAEAEHAAGRPFQIGLFTGASTGDSCDGALTRAKALRYRAPYTTNADFRKAVNAGEIAYNDIHLSQMAQELRYGFMGKVDYISTPKTSDFSFHLSVFNAKNFNFISGCFREFVCRNKVNVFSHKKTSAYLYKGYAEV